MAEDALRELRASRPYRLVLGAWLVAADCFIAGFFFHVGMPPLGVIFLIFAALELLAAVGVLARLSNFLYPNTRSTHDHRL